MLGLALLNARLLLTGQMRYYMSPNFDGLSALTGVILALMGALEVRRMLNGNLQPRSQPSQMDAALTLGLVAVPLALGLTLAPRSLGVSSLGGTPASAIVLAFDAAPPPAVSASVPQSQVVDVSDLLRYLREAGAHGVGRPVLARGLVVRSNDLPANQFVLVRYAIVHCVADAQPIGFLMLLPSEASVTADQWVEVEGMLDSASHGDDHLVAIRVQQLRAIQEPAEPYVSAF